MAKKFILLPRKQAGHGYEVTSSPAQLKETLPLGHPNYLMKCFPHERSAPLDLFHVVATQRLQEFTHLSITNLIVTRLQWIVNYNRHYPSN